MAKNFRPVSDITLTNWTDEGTVDNDGNAWTSVDEVTLDNEDSYLLSNTNGAVVEVLIESMPIPALDTGHVVHVQWRSVGSGGPEKLDIDLVEGTTVISSLGNQQNRSASYGDIAWTVLDTDIAAITDYTNLRIRATVDTVGGTEEIRISQIYMELPVTDATPSSIPAYTFAATPASDNQIAFLVGGIEDLDNQFAWLAGGIEDLDQQPAWLAGGIEDLDNQIVFLRGSIDDLDSVFAFLDSQVDSLDSKFAFTVGGIEVSDAISAFLWTLVPDSTPAWLAGGIVALDGQPAYINALAGSEDIQPAYLVGQDTTSSNIAVFTVGALHPVENTPAFLWGQVADLDNIPAFMLTDDVDLDSQSAFLAGEDNAQTGVLLYKVTLETGDLSEFDVVSDPGGNLTVTGPAALVGSYGIDFDTTPQVGGHGENDISDSQSFSATFWIDTNGITMGSGDAMPVFILWDSDTIACFDIGLYGHTTDYRLRGRIIYNDPYGSAFTPLINIDDGPHFVRVEWRAGSGPGHDDGYLKLWVDDQYGEKIGFDNDERIGAKAGFGVIWGIDPGTSGTLYLDHLSAFTDQPSLGGYLAGVDTTLDAQSAYLKGQSTAWTGGNNNPMKTIFTVDGNGIWNEATGEGDSPNWRCIDDPPGAPDDFTTQVSNATRDTFERERYVTETPFSERGSTIFLAMLNFRCTGGAQGGTTTSAIRHSGSEFAGTPREPGIGYYSYSDIFPINPSTFGSWQWSELSDIEIGVTLSVPDLIGAAAACTQVYGEVWAYDDPLPAYLKGQDNSDSAQSAYLAGGIEATSDTPAFMQVGESSSIPAFVVSGELETSNIPAFLVGEDIALDAQSAFLAGGIETLDSQSAFAAGGVVATDAIPGYLVGSLESSSSLSAFMWGSLDDLDSTPAYLAGQMDISSPWPPIKQIDFETGDLTQFDSTSGNLSVSIDAAMVGIYGMEVDLTPQVSSWGQSTTSVVSEKRWSWWVDPNSLSMATSDEFMLCVLLDNVSGTCLGASLRWNGSSYQVRAIAKNDTGGWHWGDYFTIADVPVEIRASYRKSTGVGADNGYAKVVAVGYGVSELTGLDTDEKSTDYFQLGGLWSIEPGTSGVFYLDHFLVWDELDQSVYLRGEDHVQSSAPCFLAGSSQSQSDNPAYLAASSDASGGQAAFLFGSVQVASSVPAFLQAPAADETSAVSAFIYGEVIPDYSLEASHILVYNLNGSFIRTHKMSGSFIDDYDLWGSTG